MVESVLNAAAEQVVEYGSTGTLLGREGNRGPQAAPSGGLPLCRRRPVGRRCHRERRRVALSPVRAGRPTMACGGEFSHSTGRRVAQDHIDRELARWTSRHTAEECAQMLLDAGIPSSVVVPPRDIAANPQLRHRGLFEVEEHAVTGTHEIPALPFRFSRVAHWLRSPAPTLGRDNEVVLGELGYSPAAIAGLQQSGLIGDVPTGL